MPERKVTDSDEYTIGGSPEPCGGQKIEGVVPSKPSCETSQAVEESQTPSEPQSGCLKFLRKRPLTLSEEKADRSISGTDSSPSSDSDSDGEYAPALKKIVIAQKKGGGKPKGKKAQDQVPKKKGCLGIRRENKADEQAQDGPLTRTDHQTQTGPYPHLEVPETAGEFLGITQGFIEKLVGREECTNKQFKDLEKVFEEHKATFENSQALLQQQKTTLGKSQKELAIERRMRLDMEAENKRLQATNEELSMINGRLWNDNCQLHSDNKKLSDNVKRHKATIEDQCRDRVRLSTGITGLKGEKQALESQIDRLTVDVQQQNARIVSLLEEKRAETAANKVSDDTIVRMWRTLAYNVWKVAQNLSATPWVRDIDSEDITLPIQELARRCASQPMLRASHLEQHIWSKLARSVFGNEYILWPFRAGTAFAKFCHELNSEAGNPEFLARTGPLKAQMAEIIDEHYCATEQQRVTCVKDLFDELDLLTPEVGGSHDFHKLGQQVISSAVDLHALLTKSRAVFRVAFPSPECPSALTASVACSPLDMSLIANAEDTAGCDPLDMDLVPVDTTTSTASQLEVVDQDGQMMGADVVMPTENTATPMQCAQAAADTQAHTSSRSFLSDSMEICFGPHNKPEAECRVQFVVSPFLEKIGTADGDCYDVRTVICKAQVVVE
ncbi:hypothetical protein S40288_08122 [Stachybotrys chartarum IBT 40288]|nr:hypothetical protein S40288_08122 [Stachybotrys chartarum IBT 40288]